MKAGTTFKASVGASIILHAVALFALLFAGFSMSGGKRQVFFVELKEARLVAPKMANNAEGKATAAKRRATSVKKESKAEVKPAPIVEEKPAPAPEAISLNEFPPVEEAARAETVPEEGGANFSAETEPAEAFLDSGGMMDAGFEDFALSSGPAAPGSELLAKIREAIEAELAYPPLARRRKIEGTVVAGFTIDERGAPRGIEIVESSGFSILDDEVVEIIKRASPYPYVPERVEVPVSFRLVEGR